MTTTSAPPQILGFAGYVDDIRSRAEALGDSDIPLVWTPEHVQVRLVEAFKLARREPRVGPRQHANGWPEYLREFGDLTDQIEDEELAFRRSRPSAVEMSRMTEALAWPSQFLADRLLASDALMFWALASATGRDMAEMLHRRKKRAQALADEMARRRNAPPWGAGEHGAGDCRSLADQWRAALRLQIVREVAATIPADRAQAELRRRLDAANCMPYRFKAHEARPGRVLSRTNLDRQRKIAAAAVAAGLRRQGVAVR
ncbi:MAG: hypothetical protein DI537_23830 [Stutzerimonas stutzeri]|nr:MAG: hypothetical protein DI537_23830 [Stutzerimonas stutzeri]